MIVDYVYEHCHWNSLDVHDIVKRVIEFVKTLKNIKKASEIRTMLLIFKSYANLPNETVNNENEYFFAKMIFH